MNFMDSVIWDDHSKFTFQNAIHFERKDTTEKALQLITSEVAHHLNKSLTSLLNNVEILELSSDVPSFEARQIRYIKDACEKQKAFIQKLLLASSSGSFVWSMQQITPIIKETIARVKQTIPSTVQIEVKLPSEEISLFICKEAIVESLAELINNSVAAVEDQGKIVITVGKDYIDRPQEISPYAKAGWFCVISVADNGKGIDKDQLEKVTAPFFTTARERDVAGLGLAVANGAAKAHGGGLIIHSKKERGTLVKFYIKQTRKRTKN